MSFITTYYNHTYKLILANNRKNPRSRLFDLQCTQAFARWLYIILNDLLRNNNNNTIELVIDGFF